MASADLLATSSARLPIGQTLYTTYLDAYTRRLKKGVAGPLPDAAGLVSGSRYHGRGTPLKGKGAPPPDQNEEKFVSGKHMIPGKSFTSAKELLMHHDSVDADAINKPCLRMVEQSFRSSLMGCGASVAAEAQAFKPSKRPDTARQSVDTRTRIFSEGLPPNDTDQVVAYYASLRNEPFACRPTTAPPRLARSNTEARKIYEACRQGHADVFQYRHSGGICPEEYKLVSERPSAPQLAKPAQPDAKAAFFDARRSYDINRIKSLWTTNALA